MLTTPENARSAHFAPEIVAELVANHKLVKLPTAETPADLLDAITSRWRARP